MNTVFILFGLKLLHDNMYILHTKILGSYILYVHFQLLNVLMDNESNQKYYQYILFIIY